MIKIKNNYHTHTFRCGHALGSDEDYVKNAIKFGLKEIGFSDHIILPDVIQCGMRGRYELLDDYVSSLNELKKKYKNQINIKIGFEAEYLPEFIDYYKKLLVSKKIDYLILGQHCYSVDHDMKWYLDLPGTLGQEKYTDDLIKGMASGLYKYVAHPDLFMMIANVYNETTIKCAKRIIAAAIKYNLPLEINLAQARRYGRFNIGGYNSYLYPFLPFWQLVAKSKAHVVVGFDSHRPEHVLRPGLEIIEDVIKQTGVKVDFDYQIK